MTCMCERFSHLVNLLMQMSNYSTCNCSECLNYFLSENEVKISSNVSNSGTICVYTMIYENGNQSTISKYHSNLI